MIMKKILVILIINLIFCFILNSNPQKKNLTFSLYQAVYKYLLDNYNIEKDNILIHPFNSDQLPDYKLYQIKIISNNKKKEIKNLKVQISDFFNKQNNTIIDISLNIDSTHIYSFVENVKRNNAVNIIYNKNNITFHDKGTIQKILFSDKIIVKNSFGHLVKCQMISEKTAEVIE